MQIRVVHMQSRTLWSFLRNRINQNWSNIVKREKYLIVLTPSKIARSFIWDDNQLKCTPRLLKFRKDLCELEREVLKAWREIKKQVIVIYTKCEEHHHFWKKHSSVNALKTEHNGNQNMVETSIESTSKAWLKKR